jgi:intracellular sulfur oxidation DsrE/DsrF family protein
MKRWWISLLLCWLGAQACAEVRVVYHLSDGVAQASRAMTNIRNHLEADPEVKIVVVAHGAGLDFMLDGAVGPNGQPFAGTIADLTNKGVRFEACNNTMQNRKITRDRLVMEAVVVPSGVAEVARLQAREQFVYLRP